MDDDPSSLRVTYDENVEAQHLCNTAKVLRNAANVSRFGNETSRCQVA